MKKENDYDDNGTSKHVHITPKSSTSLVDAHSPSTNISQSTETPNIFPNGSYVKTEDFLKSGTEVRSIIFSYLIPLIIVTLYLYLI